MPAPTVEPVIRATAPITVPELGGAWHRFFPASSSSFTVGGCNDDEDEATGSTSTWVVAATANSPSAMSYDVSKGRGRGGCGFCFCIPRDITTTSSSESALVTMGEEDEPPLCCEDDVARVTPSLPVVAPGRGRFWDPTTLPRAPKRRRPPILRFFCVSC